VPFAEGREPFGEIWVLSAWAGTTAMRASERAVAARGFMVVLSVGWM
jgi:hypothetical protein